MKWKFENKQMASPWALSPLIGALTSPLTSSEARLLTDIDASFNISYDGTQKFFF
jgi:hypothetical protein